MCRVSSVGLIAMAGVLLLLPTPAKAVSVTIDEIIFQGGGGVNQAVLAGTADFSLSGTTLTIILRNTSTGATGGAAATNLLTDIGFNLPGGVTILNSPGTNAVAATGGSSVLPAGTVLDDTKWAAANAGTNGIKAVNNITVLGDINTEIATLQSEVNGGFDFAGNTSPNVQGPDFGLLSAAVASGTCNAGLQCVQDSVTITLALSSAPTGLIDTINSGHVVLSFGSPNGSTVPEPSTLLLAGTALLGLGYSLRKRLFRRSKEHVAAA